MACGEKSGTKASPFGTAKAGSSRQRGNENERKANGGAKEIDALLHCPNIQVRFPGFIPAYRPPICGLRIRA
jgi:hypothetical protein